MEGISFGWLMDVSEEAWPALVKQESQPSKAAPHCWSLTPKRPDFTADGSLRCGVCAVPAHLPTLHLRVAWPVG